MNRRRPTHFEQVHPMFWLCVAIWAAGYMIHRTIHASMEPVIQAITQVSDRVER